LSSLFSLPHASDKIKIQTSAGSDLPIQTEGDFGSVRERASSGGLIDFLFLLFVFEIEARQNFYLALSASYSYHRPSRFMPRYMD
jgi:hypothetical protein